MTEAFFLAESRKDRDTFKPGLCDTDPAKVKSTLVKLFRAIAGSAETTQAKSKPEPRLLNGDHFALGLLKAKHLKKNFAAGDLKTLVSHTALRNDVTANGWEIKSEAMEGWSSLTEKVLAQNFWKTRHKETLDILMNGAVCNQTAEIAESARGNFLPNGGIPSNARDAASRSGLIHFTFANAPRMRRGMHLVVTVWGIPKSNDQGGPNDTTAVEKGWWLFDDLAKATEAEILPNASIPELAATFTDLVDTTTPMNQFIAQEKGIMFGNVVRPEKAFTGFRRVPEKGFFPGSRDGASGRGNVYLRCKSAKVQDAEPNPHPNPKLQGKDKFIGRTEKDDAGKVQPVMVEAARLELFKWYHQEFIVDVRPGAGGFEIFTMSTGAHWVPPGPMVKDDDGCTGIKKYVLNAKKPHHADLLVGAAFDGDHPDDDLFLKCYLNTDLLLKT